MSQVSPPVSRSFGFIRTVTRPQAKDPARPFVLALWILPVTGVVTAVAVAYGIGELDFVTGLITVGLLTIFLVAFVAVCVAAEWKRRETCYRITSAEFWFSPKSVRKPMRGIFDSGEALASTSAFKAGLVDRVALHDAIFTAAESAVDAKKIRAGLRELSTSGNHDLIKPAQSALTAIEDSLTAIEADLRQAAAEAASLSTKLPAPPPARETPPAPSRSERRDQLREERLAEQRRAAAVEALKASTARTAARAPAQENEITDAVSGVAAGYEEATRITHRVLHGPDLNPVADESHGRAGSAAPPTKKSNALKHLQSAGKRSRQAYHQAQAARESLGESIEGGRQRYARSRDQLREVRDAVSRKKRNL